MRDACEERNADLGAVLLLLDRLGSYRLPYARKIERKLDAGGLLSAYDIAFLRNAYEEIAYARMLAAKHAEYELLVSQAASPYGDIIRKALTNEAQGARAQKVYIQIPAKAVEARVLKQRSFPCTTGEGQPGG